MPLEGHWRRTNTPLSRRDKRLLVTVAGMAAIAAVVLVIAYAGRSAPSNADCVVVDVPSTMGGARLRSCGTAAHAFCRTQGRRNATIAAACRRQGYLADLHP